MKVLDERELWIRFKEHDDADARDELAGLMRERLEVNSLIIGQISPVIGAHVGPGALGVMAY